MSVLRTTGMALNWISGSAAGETLLGTLLNDQISGNGGRDTLRGGAGDDTYIVYDARDVIVDLSELNE